MCAAGYGLGRIPQTLDSVLVGSAERVRLTGKKAVLILGANDREFPLMPSSGGIFTLLAEHVLEQGGVVYGAVSGYYGGKVDMLMQRIIEILGGVPFLVMAILFVMFLGAGIRSFILVLIITGWIGMSRMIRAQFFRYKDYEYVLASRTMGASDRRLIFRHILPNAIGPIITQATFAVPSAIFSESFLSYLGLGIQAPEPSIGVLLAEGQGSLTTSPHLTLFPAIVVSLLMLSFNLFGNGLRDAFDPRARGSE